MVLERQNSASLTLNTMVLGLRRYLKHLQHRIYFSLERNHLTDYTTECCVLQFMKCYHGGRIKNGGIRPVLQIMRNKSGTTGFSIQSTIKWTQFYPASINFNKVCPFEQLTTTGQLKNNTVSTQLDAHLTQSAQPPVWPNGRCQIWRNSM